MNLIELLVKNTQHRIVNGGVAIAQTTLTRTEYEAAVTELLEVGYPPYVAPAPAPAPAVAPAPVSVSQPSVSQPSLSLE